jgi:hypothetical protein
MRKISAHFCLMPDGSLGKWPVIALDDSGVISEVRVHDHQFREEAGLEYYPGVLVPGIIEDLRNVNFDNV